VDKRRCSNNEDDGKNKVSVAKIARALKRTPGATTVMAAKLGITLSMRD